MNHTAPPSSAPRRRARRVIVAASAAAAGVVAAGLWLATRQPPRSATTLGPPPATAVTAIERFDHGAFDHVLQTFVDARGMVDYRRLAADRRLLDAYVAQLAAVSPRSHPAWFPSAADRMAYWVNAYNALIIRAVVDHYPTDSVTTILPEFGVFSRVTFTVGGQPLSLDDIEKGILLREFADPRVHFALTCASMSCPRLDRRAFAPDGLDARLDAEGRDFLATTDGVRLDVAHRRVQLSPYFDWYGRDFGDDHRAFVARYLAPARRAELEALRDAPISYFDYDWRLNDQAAPWAPR